MIFKVCVTTLHQEDKGLIMTLTGRDRQLDARLVIVGCLFCLLFDIQVVWLLLIAPCYFFLDLGENKYKILFFGTNPGIRLCSLSHLLSRTNRGISTFGGDSDSSSVWLKLTRQTFTSLMDQIVF